MLRIDYCCMNNKTEGQGVRKLEERHLDAVVEAPTISNYILYTLKYIYIYVCTFKPFTKTCKRKSERKTDGTGLTK